MFGNLMRSNISETLTAYLDLAYRMKLTPDDLWAFGEHNGQIVIDQLEQVGAFIRVDILRLCLFLIK